MEGDLLLRAYLGYKALVIELPKARMPRLADSLRPFIQEIEAAHPEFVAEARKAGFQ